MTKLPATKPRDAGYFPLHVTKDDDLLRAAKRDFKHELYPGNVSMIEEDKS